MRTHLAGAETRRGRPPNPRRRREILCEQRAARDHRRNPATVSLPAGAASAATLADLAEAIVAGDLVVPIQRTYSLGDVRAAYAELEAGHVAGKIVLVP